MRAFPLLAALLLATPAFAEGQPPAPAAPSQPEQVTLTLSMATLNELAAAEEERPWQVAEPVVEELRKAYSTAQSHPLGDRPSDARRRQFGSH